MSFSKSLIELEDAGLILRDQLGRKHVEYHLNPSHPEIRQLLDCVKELYDEEHDHYTRLNEVLLPLKRLSEPPPQRSLRKRWAKSQAYSYAFMLAYLMVYNTFQETRLMMRPRLPLLHELILDDIMRTRLTLQEKLIHVFEIDAPSVMKAMEEWLSEVHRYTVQASRASLRRQMGSS
jgi:hypothetical protein